MPLVFHMLGAFMAVLDIQITNASLQDIQASLGATLEEGSWISTAYLVAEIVVIPGALMLAGVWYGIKQEKPQLNLLKQGDWWGIIAMAIGLGSLQVVLEEGSRKDWFGSLTNREQFYSNRLGDTVSLYNPETQQRIDQMTQYFVSRGADLSTAQNQAIAYISNIVRREAFVMAFNDCFYFIGIALLISGLAILFFKKVKATGGAVAH
ncbi:hypothetical protein [Nostoc sp. CHAB 5715]|uniref:hypothetical protein n=1 Tax=Nostoc sp. CHAB 5715 TaxID=2780400 RepID=UPI001E461344|nr:hypothetical protein [Nostoc sp. CHAB 5715]MCC5622068.1 hypothetical protein [Nostoc sp. CHAB 5715]